MTHTIDLKENIIKKQTLRNNEYYNMQYEFDLLYERSLNCSTFNNLISLIADERNLMLAFRNLKSNKGSETRGCDDLTINDIKSEDIGIYMKRCRDKLKDFHPSKIRRVFIPKGNGKMRPLGIPCIEDRLIQQAIKQIIEPICEAKFYRNSYGFRPNRSTEHAIAKYMQYINIGHMHYVVDIDIKGFFDNVNHGKLLRQMWTIGIRDKNLLCVISKMLKCEVEGEGFVTKGTPQGGVLSPLLSNIVLNELDWWIDSQWDNMKLEKDYIKTRKNGFIDRSDKFRIMRKTSKLKEVKIVRYADDFKILCRNHKDAEKIYHAVRKWLKERLNLDISPNKSKITNLRRRKSEFLGFEFGLVEKKRKLVIQSKMTEKARKKCIENLRKRVKFLQQKPDLYNVQSYNSTVLGMQNYYRIATMCSGDFSYIDYIMRKSIRNRLKENITNSGNHSETYKRIYERFNGKSVFIAGAELFPIYAITKKNPMNFNPKVCNYTAKGREVIHEKAKGIDTNIIRYMVSNPIITRSVQYNDNRISLFYGQYGKCQVTGEFLEIGRFECHHKVPVSKGGTDEYKNLAIVLTDVHKLIHSTDVETIEKYKNKLTLNAKMVKKINSLRKLVGNDEIIINT